MSEIHASLHYLKCPKCGSEEYKPKGFEGYTLREILAQCGLRSFEYKNENALIVCKCVKCGSKFKGKAKDAEPDEILERPCTIHLTRKGGMLGAVLDFTVFLNGKKVCTVGNGQSVEIKTSVKQNLIFLTNDTGGAFSNFFRFEAVSGDNKELIFSRF
jgi:hypothetical protein